MITVSLAAAVICFMNHCYPALIGTQTPVGTYTMIRRYTEQSGYGGDVLQFHETDNSVYAVHRVWTQNLTEQREKRLAHGSVRDRIITGGCINVSYEVYSKLLECCVSEKIIITP